MRHLVENVTGFNGELLWLKHISWPLTLNIVFNDSCHCILHYNFFLFFQLMLVKNNQRGPMDPNLWAIVSKALLKHLPDSYWHLQNSTKQCLWSQSGELVKNILSNCCESINNLVGINRFEHTKNNLESNRWVNK